MRVFDRADLVMDIRRADLLRDAIGVVSSINNTLYKLVLTS